jgi:DNA polymerase I-like protein with 3'-5' exonuclease and polymerase domains
MRPPKGYVFIPADYSSQEFAIAACLAKDENMISAYESGDPYLWFGKEAGGIPKEGTKKSHPVQRGAFKSTTLGVQFGMKKKSLGKKITGDTGKQTSENEADKLIKLHQQAYPKYWKMLDTIEAQYLKTGVLQLPCGWALFKDARSTLSALNFPVQGRGSTMLHLAVKHMRQGTLKVIYTKHDEVVVMCREDEIVGAKRHIDRCMKLAYDQTMRTKDFPIRIDMSVITHEKVWISEKGADYYDLLHPYLKHFPTREDRIKHLMETVFKS